ncbi:hypothetical protein TCAL_09736 [Tigriopus californicus]|uniref:RRM domain-containing protein n=1 Tax=Tigriopus californicus TaxID=6832 RepID=A0A553PD70_TIGCA|nr:uncharacterized protein LOC131893418 [Tigriopus californicus]TRY75631.1 hypothetical protein TCAL_09736 [Tigriopus californicus]
MEVSSTAERKTRFPPVISLSSCLKDKDVDGVGSGTEGDEDDDPSAMIPQKKLEAVVLGYHQFASSPGPKEFGPSLSITSNSSIQEVEMESMLTSEDEDEDNEENQEDGEDEPELSPSDEIHAKEVNNNQVDHDLNGTKSTPPTNTASSDCSNLSSLGMEIEEDVEDQDHQNSEETMAAPAAKLQEDSDGDGVVTKVVEFTTYVLNSQVSLRVDGPDQWLCVSRLPSDLTQNEFVELVEQYGQVEETHLIHSETTGRFKGYALVLYSNPSSSIQARHVLEGQEVKGHALDCDWLKYGIVESVSLHSKCLFVDELPPDYRDMGEFRKLFSVAVNPPYCQIAIKNGVIQKWGLVEFTSCEEAETTLEKMNGHILHGHKIRVQYCIPGVHAINIYMNFINNPLDSAGDRKALLDETPSNKVYDQLDSLAKHNPWFVQSLQNIMASTSQDPNATKTNQIRNRPVPAPPAGADPAQAGLILLLAGKVTSQSTSTNETASLLETVLKQIESGVSAAEILRKLASPTLETNPANPTNPSRPVLLHTPGEEQVGNLTISSSSPPSSQSDLKSIITSLVESAQSMLGSGNDRVEKRQASLNGQPVTTPQIVTGAKLPNHPQLTDLLTKSFQARMKNGIYVPNGTKKNVSSGPSTTRQYSHPVHHTTGGGISRHSVPKLRSGTATTVSCNAPVATPAPQQAIRMAIPNAAMLPQNAGLFAMPPRPNLTGSVLTAQTNNNGMGSVPHQMGHFQYQPVVYPNAALVQQAHGTPMQSLHANPYTAAYLSAVQASQNGYYQAALNQMAAAAAAASSPSLLPSNGSTIPQHPLLWNQNVTAAGLAATYSATSAWPSQTLNGPPPVPAPTHAQGADAAGQPSALTSMTQQAYLYAAAAKRKLDDQHQYSNDLLAKKMKLVQASGGTPIMTSILPQ